MPADRATTSRWLKRLLVKGVERRHWFRLTREFPDPDFLACQREAVLCEVGGISPEVARRLRAGASDEEVEEELRLMEDFGVCLLTRFDEGFPYLLAQMSTPPTAVYVAGEIAGDDELAVGVVGPRSASTYGREITRRIATDLARAGLTVISGFAVGIDATAHRHALEAGGRTLGVLGCGLAVNYPAGHDDLRKRIREGHGALISEYPMAAPPLAGHFPPRNTLIAGLSIAVIVVEAAWRSGALVTARAALEENRHVFAVPGDVTRAKSQGSNALLRAGAIPLTCVNDLLEDLEDVLRGVAQRLESGGQLRRPTALEPVRTDPAGADPESASDRAGGPATHAPRTAQPPTDPLARLLLDRIGREPMTDLDSLMSELVPDPFDVGRLSTLLLQLELSGHIRQLPGKAYVVA